MSTATQGVAPIRQPRGPSAVSFGNTTGVSPPEPSSNALRRSNTTPRHQPSASVSSTPATSSAFHGSRFRTGGSRFRSGSLTSNDGETLGLVRKGSGREVRTEEVVIEDHGEEGGDGAEYQDFGKGLGRQSSLPSRRFSHSTRLKSSSEAMSKNGSMAPPPPRPPRRVAPGDTSMSPSLHAASQSLSSLAMFSPSTPARTSFDDDSGAGGASVSRTQSLRAQAKHVEPAGLGRSTSLRTPGEHHHSHDSYGGLSPPPLPTSSISPLARTTQNVFAGNEGGIRRHQSLNQGYGRLREPVDRNTQGLSLEQREESRRRMDEDTPRPQQTPISPITHSMWSVQAGEDGWRNTQLHEVLEQLTLNKSNSDSGPATPKSRPYLNTEALPSAPTLHSAAPSVPYVGHSTEEPSWVANLLGQGDTPMRIRSATTNTHPWQDREHALRNQIQAQPGQRWDGLPYNPQALGYLPDAQQQILTHGFGLMPPQHLKGGLNPQLGQYQLSFTPSPPYMGAPMYPTPPASAMLPTPDLGVIELARSKGLNPATYNCRPPWARFFVIKSYTEDDVQKSLKHEIWSSTVLGNKRLDTAFRESAERGPVYLFFSVNGSRHFCGVAQMLTPVDENQTSTVWAQDKWKGIFKVKWIFVRDVPSAALRHIRLTNTPEQKPITNSRDTQELPYEAGCEVLQIFLDHQTKSRTSLLQDFAYYEQMSAHRNSPNPMQGGGGPPHLMSPPLMVPQYPLGYPISTSPAPPVPPIPSRFR